MEQRISLKVCEVFWLEVTMYEKNLIVIICAASGTF